MAVTDASPEARQTSWQTAPSHVRRAGFAWLAVVGAWLAPPLIYAVMAPQSTSIINGVVAAATVALAVLVVAATIAWGSMLRTYRVRGVAVPSVVLGTVVILAWCQALAVAWARDASDVNPEAVVFLLAIVVGVSVVVIASAIAIGRERKPDS